MRKAKLPFKTAFDFKKPEEKATAPVRGRVKPSTWAELEKEARRAGESPYWLVSNLVESYVEWLKNR